MLLITGQNFPSGNSFLLLPYCKDRRVKWNGPARLYAYGSASISGGYLKCSRVLLQAPFEGLNQGLKG